MPLNPIPPGIKITKLAPGPEEPERKFQRHAFDAELGELPNIHRSTPIETPDHVTLQRTLAEKLDEALSVFELEDFLDDYEEAA